MSELEELIYGKDHANRDDKFTEVVAALDEKYPGVLPEGRYFKQFFDSTFHLGRITFKINDEANLVPQHIRDEMSNIFKECWGRVNPHKYI